MATFASARNSIAQCDVCGFRYKLLDLKALVVKTKTTNILACPACWVEDQPQLQVGMYLVVDPQAVRDPRPDNRADVTNNPIFTGWDANGWPIYTLFAPSPTSTIAGAVVACETGTLTVSIT
jgi:hypothetical protein